MAIPYIPEDQMTEDLLPAITPLGRKLLGLDRWH